MLLIVQTAIKGDERRTVLFDTGPEEEVWEHNVKRLRPDLSPVELIHLSHWHRDHSGGMGRAVRMINEARGEGNVTVDLHPNRPDYRGIMAMKPVSLEADPTFEEVEQAGGIVSTNDRPHTVAGDMFMISGEIPRVTDYEVGIKRGIRFSKATGEWTDDKLIMDERLMMCNLKGPSQFPRSQRLHTQAPGRQRHRGLYRLQPRRRRQRLQARARARRRSTSVLCLWRLPPCRRRSGDDRGYSRRFQETRSEGHDAGALHGVEGEI